MTGGVPSKSTVHHAGHHIAQHTVITMDVESFFPSVKESHVGGVLEKFGIEGKALAAMIRLTMLDGCLPQGSPMSCFLANLAFDPIDRRIHAFCRKHKIRFTRYVDDIALSSSKDIRQHHPAIYEAVKSQGFRIAKGKTMVMCREVEQIVTNLCVNHKLRPTTRYIEELDEMLSDCLQAKGPALIALEDGITIHKLKAKLRGQVEYVRRFSPNIARKLDRKQRIILWNSRIF
jgi:hypothetical protein